jgi:glycosyltransferase involved in cell wall biosynthesis
MSFSVVLPCYNEALNIEKTITDAITWFETEKIDYEIIAVDDGSTDDTFSILERLQDQYEQLVLVQHASNKGYGEALISGLDEARKEWIGFMDSDGQFKANDFAKLLACTSEFTFIAGKRSRRADPFIRSINALLYGTLVKIALRIFVRDINCGMKIFKADIWPVIRPSTASGALFNAEIFLRAKANNIVWKQVPVEHYPRVAGSPTGAKLSVILKMFAELFALKRKFSKEQKARA